MSQPHLTATATAVGAPRGPSFPSAAFRGRTPRIPVVVPEPLSVGSGTAQPEPVGSSRRVPQGRTQQ